MYLCSCNEHYESAASLAGLNLEYQYKNSLLLYGSITESESTHFTVLIAIYFLLCLAIANALLRGCITNVEVCGITDAALLPML